MDLTYARLGNTYYRSDFAEIEILLVVKAHHHFFALGQMFDRIDECAAKALIFNLLKRVIVIVGPMPFEILFFRVVATQLIQMQQLATPCFVEKFVILGYRHLQLCRHLTVRGYTA